jgi:thymidylate synthase
MHLKFRNVNGAFKSLVSLFNDGSLGEDWGVDELVMASVDYANPNGSGRRFQIMEPVLLTYREPRERVLFHPGRDANPFFHLYEALYMLTGRNDVAPLNFYLSKWKDMVSDDGVTQNAAYGYRWRRALDKDWDGDGYSQPIDQLKTLIDHLHRKPESSRAVLAMWNVEDDLLKMDSSGDICCNLNAIFSIRSKECENCIQRNKIRFFIDPGPCTACEGKYGSVGKLKYLDMTVTNRSNDLIWGLLGANYVQFSVLQEYMAAHLGVKVGLYHHMTTNLHIYESGPMANWKPEVWLADSGISFGKQEYPTPLSLVYNPETFDKELHVVVEAFSGKNTGPRPEIDRHHLTEPFLRMVAVPMFRAFELHKAKQPEVALECCGLIEAEDWRVACTDWLKRRIK